MLYDVRLLPSPEAFEILVYLVLKQEHPTLDIRRVRTPDWGIDIHLRGPRISVICQCKHYPTPRVAQIRRGVADSLAAACAHRDRIAWKRLILAFSGDLTAPQRDALSQLMEDFGIHEREVSIRSGPDFTPTLAKHPHIWQIAAAVPTRPETFFATAPSNVETADSKLQKVIDTLNVVGRRRYVSDVLHDAGVNRIGALHDWYQIALPFYRNTRRVVRLMTFDSEIAIFWLTNRGGPYLEMNMDLAKRGVDVRRIFVVDFALQHSNPLAFFTYLNYCAAQERVGLNCKVLPMDVFRESIQFDCEIFCVQDRNNVMLYAPHDLAVTFSRKPSFISEAIEAYDALFNHKEAGHPAYLARKFAANPVFAKTRIDLKA